MHPTATRHGIMAYGNINRVVHGPSRAFGSLTARW
jgi:hypothetical protein